MNHGERQLIEQLALAVARAVLAELRAEAPAHPRPVALRPVIVEVER
ncbi:MAG: hypothetical protein GY937_26510 [bacterium]|nr:hypothetical protein [bacterium]